MNFLFECKFVLGNFGILFEILWYFCFILCLFFAIVWVYSRLNLYNMEKFIVFHWEAGLVLIV